VLNAIIILYKYIWFKPFSDVVPSQQKTKNTSYTSHQPTPQESETSPYNWDTLTATLIDAHNTYPFCILRLACFIKQISKSLMAIASGAAIKPDSHL
jgi:hypothetical protein